MMPLECGVALGSNSGDREANLRAAMARLRSLDPRVTASRVYETAPVDCPDGSGAFLNAAAILNWDGSPHALLDALRSVEAALGRPALRDRNAPRTIDLDILFAGTLVCADERLELPHPRLHLRRFVLAPLCDLRPDLVLPGFTVSVAALLAGLPPEPSPPAVLEHWAW